MRLAAGQTDLAAKGALMGGKGSYGRLCLMWFLVLLSVVYLSVSVR